MEQITRQSKLLILAMTLVGVARALYPINKCYGVAVTYSDNVLNADRANDGYYGYQSVASDPTFVTASASTGATTYIMFDMGSSQLIRSVLVVNRDTTDSVNQAQVSMGDPARVFVKDDPDGTQNMCSWKLDTSGWYKCNSSGRYVGISYTDATTLYLSEFTAYTQADISASRILLANWVTVETTDPQFSSAEDAKQESGPLRNIESDTQINAPSVTDSNYFYSSDHNAYYLQLHMLYKIDAVLIFAAEGDDAPYLDTQGLEVYVYDSDMDLVGQCLNTDQSYTGPDPLSDYGNGLELVPELYRPEFVCGDVDADGFVAGYIGDQVVIKKGSDVFGDIGFRSVRVMVDFGDDTECDCGTVVVPDIASVSTLNYVLDSSSVTNGSIELPTFQFNAICPSECYAISNIVSDVTLKDHTFSMTSEFVFVFTNTPTVGNAICEGTYIYSGVLVHYYTNPSGTLVPIYTNSFPLFVVNLTYQTCEATTLSTFDITEQGVAVTTVTLTENDVLDITVQFVFPMDTTSDYKNDCVLDAQCQGTRSFTVTYQDGATIQTSWTLTYDDSTDTGALTMPYTATSIETKEDFYITAVLVLVAAEGGTTISQSQSFQVITEASNPSCDTTVLNDFAALEILITLNAESSPQTLTLSFPTDTESVTTGVECTADRTLSTLTGTGISDGSSTDEYFITFVESGADTQTTYTVTATYFATDQAYPQSVTQSVIVNMQTALNCKNTVLDAITVTALTVTSENSPESDAMSFPTDSIGVLRVAAGFTACTDYPNEMKIEVKDNDGDIVNFGYSPYSNYSAEKNGNVFKISVQHDEQYEDITHNFSIRFYIKFSSSDDVYSASVGWTATQQSDYDCSRTTLDTPVLTAVDIIPASSPSAVSLTFPTDSISTARIDVPWQSLSGCSGTSQAFQFSVGGVPVTQATHSWFTYDTDASPLSAVIAHVETGSDVTYQFDVSASFVLDDGSTIESLLNAVGTWDITHLTQYDCADTTLESFEFATTTVSYATSPVSVQFIFPNDSMSVERTSLGFSACDGDRFFDGYITATNEEIPLSQFDGETLIATIDYIAFDVDTVFEATIVANFERTQTDPLAADYALLSESAAWTITFETQPWNCTVTVLDAIQLSTTEIALDSTTTQETLELTFPNDSEGQIKLNNGETTGCNGTRTFSVQDTTGTDITTSSTGSIVFDSSTYIVTITFVTADSTTSEVYTVTAALTLTDGTVITPVTTTFTVTLTQDATKDTYPEFLIEPSEDYYVELGSTLSIDLSAWDYEFDDFTVTVDMGGSDLFGDCLATEEGTGTYQIRCSFSPTSVQTVGESYEISVTLEQVSYSSTTQFHVILQSPEEVAEDGDQDGKDEQEREEVQEEEVVFEVPYVGWTPPSSNFDHFYQPLRVKRSNVTTTGLVTIEYNQNVETKIEFMSLKFKQLSDSIDLDFKYNVTFNEQNFVKIQLRFQRPLLVSSGWEPDYVEIYIPILVDDPSRVLSQLEFLKVELQMPRQVSSEEENESLIQSQEAAAKFVGTAFWIYIVLALLLKGVMGMLWGLFQALQLITSFPLFWVKVPTNILIIQSGFMKILNLEIVDKKEVYDSTFGFVFTSDESQAQYNSTEDASSDNSDAKEQLGFKETNMLKQVGLILIGLIVFFTVVCCICVCWKCVYPRLSVKIKNLFIKIKGKIMWNTILRTSIQSYLTLGITTLFRLESASEAQKTDIFIMVLMILFLVIWPAVTYKVVQRQQHVLDKAEVRTSIGTLYLNQDIHKVQSCKEYHMWFMYRRLIFALTIVMVNIRAPMIQIGLTAHLSLYVMAYLMTTQPMEKKHHNWLAVFNEVVVYGACVIQVVFTDFVSDPEFRHEMGYTFLDCLYSFVGVNMFIMCIDLTVALGRSWRRMRKLRKHKKQIEQQRKKQQATVAQIESEAVQMEFDQNGSSQPSLAGKGKIIIVQTEATSQNSQPNLLPEDSFTVSTNQNPKLEKVAVNKTGARKLNQSDLSSSYVQSSSFESSSFEKPSSSALYEESVSYYTESEKEMSQIRLQIEVSYSDLSEFSVKLPREMVNATQSEKPLEVSQWPETPSDQKQERPKFNDSLLMPLPAHSSLHLESDFFESQRIPQLPEGGGEQSNIQSEKNDDDYQYFSFESERKEASQQKSGWEISMTSSQIVNEILDRANNKQ